MKHIKLILAGSNCNVKKQKTKWDLTLILPLCHNRSDTSGQYFVAVVLKTCRDVSIRGMVALQGSRLEAVASVVRCHTELHHELPEYCCQTWGSHTRALWLKRTGRSSGYWDLEETGSSDLSPHSGTQRSEGGYRQTTGCCTDCTKRKKTLMLS